MGHISNDEFFSRLTELFERRRSKDHGAIYLSQKRLSHGQDLPAPSAQDPLADLHLSHQVPILIRASNGKSKEERARKVKLATVVDADGLDAFYARYAEICKAGMTTLKPRDRSKRKTKARKKKGGAAIAS